MGFPKYTPDYAREEFTRLMEIWQDDKRFNVLNDWLTDSRMKFVYESLQKSNREQGYFILAMLDSYTTDLDKFKRKDDLTAKIDGQIMSSIAELKKLLSDRLGLNGYAPEHYYDLQDYLHEIKLQEKPEVFTPNMVKQANATRQTKTAKGILNKARLARAFITNLEGNGFNVSAIKPAISEALNIIYESSEFSINDVENVIKAARKLNGKNQTESTER